MDMVGEREKAGLKARLKVYQKKLDLARGV